VADRGRPEEPERQDGRTEVRRPRGTHHCDLEGQDADVGDRGGGDEGGREPSPGSVKRPIFRLHVGTRPITVVPDLGTLVTASSPPIAARRSAIPCSPVP